MTATAILDDLLVEMQPDQREAFKADYAAVSRLASGALPLQEFLDEYLRRVVSLYAATAGVIWFRSPDSSTVTPKSRIGFEQLGLRDEYAAAHDKLLLYGLHRPTSFLVKPCSAPAAKSGVSNPTDSFVILGPVRTTEEPLGLVELFLGPTPSRGKTATDRQRYTVWLDHLLTFLCRGLEQRFLAASAPLPLALSGLQAVKLELDAHQAAIRAAIERTLNSFTGWNFGSLANNQAFAQQVQDLLESHGLRVICPECGSAAILRCQAAGNAKTGVFLYDHSLATGRTFHGGPTTFPRVALTAKPPRKKRS